MGLAVIQMSEQSQTKAEMPPPDAIADLALVAAARRDPRAFGALYDRYVTRIYRYSYARLRNAPAAEDATSQTFLKALQALPQFRDGVFIAWLYRIAHNVCADMVRRGGPATNALDAMDFDLETGDSTQDAAIRSTERAAFYQALDELPDEQRTVLEMTASGFNGNEIARLMGKTHASVKMLRWRGMEAIKARIARQGLLSEVGE